MPLSDLVRSIAGGRSKNEEKISQRRNARKGIYAGGSEVPSSRKSAANLGNQVAKSKARTTRAENSLLCRRKSQAAVHEVWNRLVDRRKEQIDEEGEPGDGNTHAKRCYHFIYLICCLYTYTYYM